MPADYFEDGPQQETAMPKEGMDDAKGDQPGKGDEKTGLINSDLCPGMKPGDTIQLRILAVHDSEYSVKYEDKGDEPKDEPEGPGPEEADMPAGGDSPPGGMDSMMD